MTSRKLTKNTVQELIGPEDQIRGDMAEMLVLAATMGFELDYFVFLCEEVIYYYDMLEKAKGEAN